jgi:hypothetical protein
MGLGLFKKKKETEEFLPPPPPLISDKRFVGDFEPIKPKKNDIESFDFNQVPNLNIPEIEMDAPKEVKKVDLREDFFEEEDEFVKDKNIKGPVFVSLSDYEKVDVDCNSIKSLLKESDESLKELNKLLEDENLFFKNWRAYLEGIEKKLVFVEKIMSENSNN